MTFDKFTYDDIASTIDHAILQPTHTEADVREGCKIAMIYRVKSVCVKPCHVRLAAECLRGSNVLVGTVISFPHGNSAKAVKVAESLQALNDGAIELDVVVNLGWIKSAQWEACLDELKAIVTAARGCRPDAVIKVILETAVLTREEIKAGCQAATAAGANFVKTSTGFASSGATLENVRFLRENTQLPMQVKASGGIKTLNDVVEYITSGATRCGTSSTVAILDEYNKLKQA